MEEMDGVSISVFICIISAVGIKSPSLTLCLRPSATNVELELNQGVCDSARPMPAKRAPYKQFFVYL